MTIERAPQRGVVAVVTVATALVSGCTAAVDPEQLPGVYRNEETGGEVVLEPDGTFSATGISGAESVGNGDVEPADFSGEWEFVDSRASSDFIYLTVDDGMAGDVGGVQLHTSGRSAVAFHADPDGPPSLTLTLVE